MARTLKLLLTENVENTGIVGDVVNVRKGYARNFLLPRKLATEPSDDLIKQLQTKRADALKQLDTQREERTGIIEKLKSFELTMIRSCNDQGILYAAVTQQDIAQALASAGHNGITAREVRIGQNIKRIDNYEIHVKFDAELDTVIKVHVQADRKLELERRGDEKHEPEAKQGEGQEVKDAKPGEPGAKAPEGKAGKPGEARPRGDRDSRGGGDRGGADRGGGGDRGGGDRGGAGGDRPVRREREDRGGRGGFNISKMDFTEKRVIGWGDAPAKTDANAAGAAKPEGKGKGKGGEAKGGESKGDKVKGDKADKGGDKKAEGSAEKGAESSGDKSGEKPKGEKKAKK